MPTKKEETKTTKAAAEKKEEIFEIKKSVTNEFKDGKLNVDINIILEDKIELKNEDKLSNDNLVEQEKGKDKEDNVRKYKTVPYRAVKRALCGIARYKQGIK